MEYTQYEQDLIFECEQHNSKVFRIWLFGTVALMIASIVSMVVSMLEGIPHENSGATFLGYGIGAAFVEMLACGGTFLTTLLAFLLYSKKRTAAKIFIVFSRIFAIIGILLWGFQSAPLFIGNTNPLGVWFVLTFCMHTASFVLPFFRKKVHF